MALVKGSDRHRGQHGFSLMEVIVSTLIAAIAVVGLAHMFGIGRGQIERFETARVALAAVEQRLESLALLDRLHPDLAEGQHDAAFVVDGAVIGDMRWIVTYEPFSWTSGATYEDTLKRVMVEASWDLGMRDTVRLTRYFEK